MSGKRHDTLGLAPGEHVARATIHDSLSIDFTAFAQQRPDEPLPSRSASPR